MSLAAPILLGPVAAGTRLFSVTGKLRVAVIAKVTFALVHDGRVTTTEPEPLVRRDAFVDGDPLAGLAAASDLAPFKPLADVTLTGTAHAQGSEPVTSAHVRLAVGLGAAALFDKRVVVTGPAFRSARLRSFVVPQADPSEIRVVSASDPTSLARLGPVGAYTQERKLLLAGLNPGALETHVFAAPPGFAWAYFQSAPKDQQIAHLSGFEWIALDGMHAERRVTRTQLSGARAVARAYLLDGSGGGRTSDVQLVADTLLIDADRARVSIVFRGRVAVEGGEAALDALRIAVGLETPGAALGFPPIGAVARVSPRPEPVDTSQGRGETVDAAASAGGAAATPFEEARRAAPRPSPSPAPTPPEAAPPAPKTSPKTVQLTAFDQAQAAVRAVAPYAVATGSTADADQPGIAGAPWSDVPAGPAPPSVPEFEETWIVEARSPAAAAPSTSDGDAAGTKTRRRGDALVPLRCRSPLGVATFPWSFDPPALSLVVVVKGTFALTPSAPARLRGPAPRVTGDVRLEEDATTGSLVTASEFAPFKPRCDVTLVGRARAPEPVTATRVALRFGRAAARVDKAAAVVGHRVWRRGTLRSSHTEPDPFEEMPLTWERAFGGAAFEENPVGAGHGAGHGTPLPNVERLDRPIASPSDEPEPIGFGPVPPEFRSRRVRLGTYDAAWLAKRWPFYPVDFDFGSLQSAPEGQQVPHLVGDEPFELEGVTATRLLAGELPGLRVRCVVRRVDGAVVEVPVALDTVSFDADRVEVDLCWRGRVAVVDDEASDLAVMAVATEPLAGPAAAPDEILRAAELVELPRLEAEAARPPARPANDDSLDAATRELEAALAGRQKALEEKMAAAGFGSAPAVTPDPAALAAALVARGEGAEAAEAVLEAVAGPREQAGPDLRQHVKGRIGRGEPLDGADLDGADLSDLDLTGASLKGASLRRARLVRAKLDGANLTGARADGVDLSSARLEGAILDDLDAPRAKLADARLASARLSRANLDHAEGARADLRGARGERPSFADGVWDGARFDGAELIAADLSRSSLAEATFVGAKLPDVRLFDVRAAGARFDGADLSRARAAAADLRGASLVGARAEGAGLEGAMLEGASLERASLAGATFDDARAARASFAKATLRGASLRRADLEDTSFLEADLMKATLERANLRGADLRGANLYGAEVWRSTRDGALTDGALVAGSKLEKAR